MFAKIVNKGEQEMAPRNIKVNATEVHKMLDTLFATLDAMLEDAMIESIENRVKSIRADINSYFDALAKSAQELRKDNNPLNDSEIISGRYKQDILKIIEKYFPNER